MGAPMDRFFTFQDLLRCGRARQSLENWLVAGIIRPVGGGPGRGGARLFSFRPALGVSAAAARRRAGLPFEPVRKAVGSVERAALPARLAGGERSLFCASRQLILARRD